VFEKASADRARRYRDILDDFRQNNLCNKLPQHIVKESTIAEIMEIMEFDIKIWTWIKLTITGSSWKISKEGRRRGARVGRKWIVEVLEGEWKGEVEEVKIQVDELRDVSAYDNLRFHSKIKDRALHIKGFT
jgi:hypothetical protein